MQINSTSQPAAAVVLGSTTTAQSQTEQAQAADTLKDDTVSISAQAQEQNAQSTETQDDGATAYSGSSDGVWPTKPK